LSEVVQLAGHALRYGLVGATIGLLYVGLTLALSGPVGLPIQVAIVIALTVALTSHFLLQRNFVFRHAMFALSVRGQLRRYLVVGSLQYAVAVAATSALPALLGLSEQVAYIAITAVSSIATFLFLRWRVFHRA
jgi:putative flippase GtrA